MRIADIDFPEKLMAALRDNTLVVFAGAGVSMGEPACLPDFQQLACDIAKGTGEDLQKGEPEDRFLGRLHHQKGTDVHVRAAEVLSPEGLKPTDLHVSLLQLFTKEQEVRLVTTNLDELFEQAAETEGLFDAQPKVYRAPALPLGHDFNGIIHIHGAVSSPHEMVLTDKDFGRAYLTKGWARRFLVALFREYTVLFVGYSHSDTDMHYLARALPVSEVDRFVLTEADCDDPQRWQTIGIEPIIYPNSSKDDYSALYKGVERLAGHTRRGVLEWQYLIRELAQRPPPLNENDADIIEEALTDEVKVRFFTEHASSPEWIDWLDRRKHLDALFGHDELSGRDGVLSWWIAKRFARKYPNKLFLLIGKHNVRLHPNLWWKIGHEVSNNEAGLDSEALSRWVSVLLADLPVDLDFHNVLSSLAALCVHHGLLKSLMQMFDAMTASNLSLKQGFPLDDDEDTPIRAELRMAGKSHALWDLWGECLKPKIDHVVEPVISLTTRRLEEREWALSVWKRSENWERPAIEDHEQNKTTGLSTILVNVARDSLEWLVESRAGAATRWRNKLAISDAPLLRRLALHVACAQRDPTSDEKIDWLLANVDIHDPDIHHEVFRLVALAYPEADKKSKEALIEAVRKHRWEGGEDSRLTPRQIEAWHQLNWFHWLYSKDPGCTLAKQARDEASGQLPGYEPREHPDFLSYSEMSFGPRSPWTVEELLERPAASWRDELLTFDPNKFYMINRHGLLDTVTKAAKQNFIWGFELAKSLEQVSNWEADLWPSLLHAWMATDLIEEQYRKVLSCLENVSLGENHAYEVANVLFSLVQNEGKPYALKLLPRANKIALALWQDLDCEERDERQDDWLERAHDHTAGRLTEFLLHGLSVWRNVQDPTPKSMNDEYRVGLSAIVQDSTLRGKLGLSVLASEFPFLLTVDRSWALDYLLPSFDPKSDNWQVAREALARIVLNPSVAELLEKAFLDAVQWSSSKSEYLRGQFILRYIYMVAYFVEDPLDTWILRLFSYGGEGIREVFSSSLNEDFLWDMDEATQREWWRRWLKGYWENRLQGVPVALSPKEVSQMLHWPAKLTAVFPEAVQLAVQMGTPSSDFGNLLYYLGESNLLKRYPNELASFLLHLDNIGVQEYWWDAKEMINELLDFSIPENLKHKLRELMANQGIEE